MSVYDKELIIDGKAVRSPEQQVYKNMKDIKKLQEIIKPEYTTDAELTDASVSVAIADTNVPEGTTEGWLLTQDGLKFKITGGDETNLLLEFYAKLSGKDAADSIDDSTTSAEKLWSSLKTSNEIVKAKDKGLFITSVEPTEDDGVYTLSTGSIDNPSTQDINVKVNDIIIYIDSSDHPTSMWQVAAISGTTITVVQVAEFGGGNQLYRHNLYFTHDSPNYRFWITIENDKDTPFTETSLIQYMQDKGYTSGNFLKASGSFYDGGLRIIFGVYRISTTQYNICYQDTSGGISSSWTVNLNFFTIKDDVQPV